MLRENKALTSLDISHCGLLGLEGLCEVCNAVTMNTTLTSLYLSENTFDDQSIASLGTLSLYVIFSGYWLLLMWNNIRTVMSLVLA